MSSTSLLVSSLSSLIDLAVDSVAVTSFVVIFLMCWSFFVADAVILVAFCSFFFVGVLKVNVMGGGAVIVVLDPKGVFDRGCVAVIALGEVFVVIIVVLLVLLPFFLWGDPKENVLGDVIVIVVLGTEEAGGAAFPMVGIHVELIRRFGRVETGD